MTPATDSLATVGQIARYAGVGQLAGATGHRLRGLARAIRLRRRTTSHAIFDRERQVAVPGAAETCGTGSHIKARRTRTT